MPLSVVSFREQKVKWGGGDVVVILVTFVLGVWVGFLCWTKLTGKKGEERCIEREGKNKTVRITYHRVGPEKVLFMPLFTLSALVNHHCTHCFSFSSSFFFEKLLL